MRVAVIFHRFGPYHCARLEAAARHCDVTGIEVAAETQDYAWSRVKDTPGYSGLTLFPSGDTRTMSDKQISTRVENALQSCSPDAVAIPGWSDKGALAALRWCMETGTPPILMSESTALDEPRVRWREWIKERIIRLYSTALVGGQRHIDYLIELGMPSISARRRQRSEIRDQRSDGNTGCRRITFSRRHGSLKKRTSRHLSALMPDIAR